MSTVTTAGEPISGRSRASTLAPVVLVSVHVLALIAMAAWAGMVGPPGAPRVWLHPFFLYIALVNAQASLLALWAAFSTAWPGWRIGGLVLGTFALTVVTMAELDQWEGVMGVVPLAVTVLVVSTALLARFRFGTRLVWQAWETPTAREGLRFSIRGLMLLTLAIALAIGLVRAMTGARQDLAQLLGLGVVSLTIAVPALVVAWASLGLAPFGLRALAALSTSLFLTALFGYATEADELWMIAMILEVFFGPTLIVLVSLLAARAAGYRLVGRQAGGERIIAG